MELLKNIKLKRNVRESSKGDEEEKEELFMFYQFINLIKERNNVKMVKKTKCCIHSRIFRK